ncbi:MAG: dihydroorotate dehydrogenase-like protein [Rubrimonas sp.]|uniref:dihydroorotate dehydrogenase-like protein n=1 Tax=Rubrimonas sp. TaxID=2036015 RepID=UPI002FDEA0E9
MDLTTEYLGLRLAHPAIASAGPHSASFDGIRRLEDGGAAAVVTASLFEEQLLRENAALDHAFESTEESFGEATSYFPDLGERRIGPEAHLELIRRASEACAIPVIGSLNGVTTQGWTEHARLFEQAGAAALELNIFHIPADLATTGREVEDRYVETVRAVAAAVAIPVAIKLSPFFSATGEMARRFAEAGAAGLVLFNRFYQPDFDLDALEVAPRIELSAASEIRLPLLWIAILHGRLAGCSLAATRGVQTSDEVVKYLLAGADAVMSTSAALRHGPGHFAVLRDGLRDWMQAKGYSSVAQMKGAMSQRNVADPDAFERANYLRVLDAWPRDRAL